jgi:hypothetical protein
VAVAGNDGDWDPLASNTGGIAVVVSMAGGERRDSARIRASSLADKPTGTGVVGCECRPEYEE